MTSNPTYPIVASSSSEDLLEESLPVLVAEEEDFSWLNPAEEDLITVNASTLDTQECEGRREAC